MSITCPGRVFNSVEVIVVIANPRSFKAIILVLGKCTESGQRPHISRDLPPPASAAGDRSTRTERRIMVQYNGSGSVTLGLAFRHGCTMTGGGVPAGGGSNVPACGAL